jgi:phosphoribosylanthranilate isomerase
VKDWQTVEHLLRHGDLSPTPTAPTELPQYLLEMSSGILPGGNGASWDWAAAKPFCEKFRTILAGGLNADNILQALEAAEPFGIDVSSGVENSPGIKDFDKVRILIDKVRSVGF